MYELNGKVILLNGPMGTGKDLAADVICEMADFKKYEFKDTIFNIAMAITGLSRKDFFAIYNDRELKEKPHKAFLGLSPRKMMIWISEDVCKPKFGEEYFGMPAAASIDPKFGAVFSDSGFPEEVAPIARSHGAENVFVIRFTRNGAKFDTNDSRNYLQPGDCPKGVHFIDLVNDSTIGSFCTAILNWVKYHD